MHNSILNIVTPLQSQGITSITFDQIKSQLQNDPDFVGIDITDDLISQAIQDINGMNAEPDTANNGKMTITFDSGSQSPGQLAQTDQGEKTVDQAATRQATKDLGAPNAF